MSTAGQAVEVAGRELRLTHPDKVMYPATGTTKADVLDYLLQVAPYLVSHVAGRPVTRKRWVDGVGTAAHPGSSFFEKNLPRSAPDWLERVPLEHETRTTTYPLIEDAAGLAWAGQMAALELHVPPWRVDEHGTPRRPDRLVLDLDPGPGAGLPECVEVARHARRLLRDVGLTAHPITSGSKGIHLYAGLDGSHDNAYLNDFAHELAQALEAELPDLVVSSMAKKVRRDKVLVDWSQNNGHKTTIAPYSLRGTLVPRVAAPRTWREMTEDLQQLTLDDVVARMRRRKDPLAELAGSSTRTGSLAAYRSKRDPRRTPEPVPHGPDATDGRSFVIQEHDASSLHWDLRLERDGVLVSWALPKGVPTDPRHNRLAIRTEDHPLDYASFEGTIPAGEYGGGTVRIWDAGTYERHTWHEDGEVVVTLRGRPGGGLGGPRKLALIRTSENWLVHLMDASRDESAPVRSTKGRFVEPMLATLGSVEDIGDEDDWAFEMKWDGIRIVAVADHADVSLFTRRGADVKATYPEIAAALREADLADAVVDGEVVALDHAGAPSFSLLQRRSGLTRDQDVERARSTVPVVYMAFDLMRSGDRSLSNDRYEERRSALLSLGLVDHVVRTPKAFEGALADAVEWSQQLGLEGVLAKRRTSRYRGGARSSSWIKIKHHRMQEVVVGGWRPGRGRRSGAIGSLLLGVPDEDGLRYVGRVGTGFDRGELDRLEQRLRSTTRKTSPFHDEPRDVARDAVWVTPRLVGEVTFAEWTARGRLRQPSWRGIRADKQPSDVRIE